MNNRARKTRSSQRRTVSNGSRINSGYKAAFQFVDNRSEAIAQRKLQNMASQATVQKYQIVNSNGKYRIANDLSVAVKQVRSGSRHVLYAKAGKAAVSNKILNSAKSHIVLKEQGGEKEFRNQHGLKKKLKKVEAYNRVNKTSGDNMKLTRDCGVSSAQVMGADQTGRKAIYSINNVEKKTNIGNVYAMKTEIAEQWMTKSRRLVTKAISKLDEKLTIHNQINAQNISLANQVGQKNDTDKSVLARHNYQSKLINQHRQTYRAYKTMYETAPEKYKQIPKKRMERALRNWKLARDNQKQLLKNQTLKKLLNERSRYQQLAQKASKSYQTTLIQKQKLHDFIKVLNYTIIRAHKTTSERIKADIMWQIIHSYAPQVQNKISKELKINEYAEPQVGEGFSISRGGPAFPGKGTWNYHWAGVIMKSDDGAEKVTLENNASTQPSGENTKWSFQIYGKAKQSFHVERKNSRVYGRTPTTTKVRKA